MSKIQWKGSTLLAPVPAALVSCGTLEKPNALTIAWTGITCSDPPMTYISVRPERYSYDTIKESGEFVINLTSGAMARATDFCGVRSGREMDKLAATGLTVEPAKEIAAPVIAQSPLALECRVKQIIPLGSHDMFLVLKRIHSSLLQRRKENMTERVSFAFPAADDRLFWKQDCSLNKEYFR